MPNKVQGKATGWIYILVKQYTPDAASYETTQFNGYYCVIFCRNNLKDGVINEMH